MGTFGRYLITGGLLFLIDSAVFFALVQLAETQPFAAQAISRLTGAIVGFFGHRHFTFFEARSTGAGAAAQGVAYTAIGVFMLFLTPIVLHLFLQLVNGSVLAAKVFTELFAVLFGYLALKCVFAAKRT
jgi:putative flippase GtrA